MNLTRLAEAIDGLCADADGVGLEQLMAYGGCKRMANLDLDSMPQAFWPMHVRVIMTVVFASLSAVGIIGNILVITVVFRVKGMITPTNCYLVSLAASDCLFFLATAPTELSYLHLEDTEYIFGYLGCALFTFLPYLAINTSSLSIAAFTIERYIGICHPLRARYICTVKRARTIIGLIWLFCFVYNSPWLYLASLTIDHGEYSCSFKLERDHFTYKVMFMGDLVAFYVVPMLLYIVIYSKIAYALTRTQISKKESTAGGSTGSQKSHKQRRSTCSQDLCVLMHSRPSVSQSPIGVRTSAINGGGQHKGKNQVVKMLALVVAIFAICWLPYRAMVMYNSFAQLKWDPDWYIFLSKTMIFFNCAINPVLYNVMSARFRNAFRSLLRGRRKIVYQIQHRRSGGSYGTKFRGGSAMDSGNLLEGGPRSNGRTSLSIDRRVISNISQNA